MTCTRKIGPFDCCSVVQGDCLELMKQLPLVCECGADVSGEGGIFHAVGGHANYYGGIDAIVTDPPYGIFKRTDDGMMFGKPTIYSTDKSAAQWDKRPDGEILRRLMTGAPKYVIWGGNYFADELGSCKSPLIWNKETGNNSYADGECAWSNVAGTMRIFTHQWCGAFKDSERGQRAMHPTQKPVALMSWCIELADAETILDPFCGSGTTLVAAKKLGRHFLGFEISEQYCEIARDRLARIDAQPSLFTPKPEQLELGQ